MYLAPILAVSAGLLFVLLATFAIILSTNEDEEAP